MAEFAALPRKSSNPSPPDITRVVVVGAFELPAFDVEILLLLCALFEPPQPPAGVVVVVVVPPVVFNSTLVRNRTCPVWPYEIPVRLDTMCCRPFVDELTGRFSNTPALVPIHSRSLQARREVMRRHADLCWRIMSSQVDSILFTGLLTSISNSNSKLGKIQAKIKCHALEEG